MSNADLTQRMFQKHGQINRKHEMQRSNVDLTRNILKEYRYLKKEESNLK